MAGLTRFPEDPQSSTAVVACGRAHTKGVNAFVFFLCVVLTSDLHYRSSLKVVLCERHSRATCIETRGSRLQGMYHSTSPSVMSGLKALVTADPLPRSNTPPNLLFLQRQSRVTSAPASFCPQIMSSLGIDGRHVLLYLSWGMILFFRIIPLQGFPLVG